MVEDDIRVFQQELLKEDGVVHHAGNGQRLTPAHVEATYLLDALVQGGQGLLHMVQEALAALVQDDLAPAALKEGDAHLLLQTGEGGAQVGLGDKHGFRRL